MANKLLDANGLAHFWENIDARKANRAPFNYAFDGVDLSTIFTPAELHTALGADDFEKIRVGDYWPVTLNGDFRDYGAYTVPIGTTYYSDAALTTSAGTTIAVIEAAYESATAVKFKVSGADVYAASADCLDYFVRTCSNAVLKLEIAGINHYWRYGDSGALAGNLNHLVMVSRDCLPFYLRMRKANAVWENTEAVNPWLGAALFKTLNDPDHGIISLLTATPIGAYIYGGASGGGMRALLETKAAGAETATSWAWSDRGKLWLPTEREIWGSKIWSEETYGAGLTPQFPLFRDGIRHVSKGIGNGGSRYAWWSSSSCAGYSTFICLVISIGYPNSSGAVDAIGVPVCFLFI